jgi:glycerol-3-phosphate acyltransferase PlsY
MTFWITTSGVLVVAYLLGALPTGYLAGRLLRGVDLRKVGSGSTGATNVLRTLGPWPALAVFSVDLLKGAAAILLARELIGEPWVIALAGLAAVVGHSRSIWLRFSGGKSAATGLGVLLALAWPVGLGAAAVVGVTLALFRIMSLSSMLGALSAMALVFVLPEPLPYRLLVIAGGLYVLFRHRANIQRLLAGREPRFGKAL